MAFSDAGSFLVGELLVLFVMAMIGIDEIAELSDFVLDMDGADFRVVEICSCGGRRTGSARVLYCGGGGSEGRGGGEVT